MWQRLWPRKHGEERVYFAYISLNTAHQRKLSEESRAGIWRQDLKHRPCVNYIPLLFLHSLLSLHSYTTHNYFARVDIPYSGLVLTATSIINQKNALQSFIKEMWWRHFLNRGSYSQAILACVTNKTTTNPILYPLHQLYWDAISPIFFCDWNYWAS